ncbi:unnamed protein product [Ambrosiozyma monospora]|uniref:Unnamed protein product n=1 Tax=Ambrosiozyma monospora TaxID=43982 RepID=A0ACB5UAU7_AMBMO|nr:unnamed protein product [Ambrosiozyma monospora]
MSTTTRSNVQPMRRSETSRRSLWSAIRSKPKDKDRGDSSNKENLTISTAGTHHHSYSTNSRPSRVPRGSNYSIVPPSAASSVTTFASALRSVASEPIIPNRRQIILSSNQSHYSVSAHSKAPSTSSTLVNNTIRTPNRSPYSHKASTSIDSNNNSIHSITGSPISNSIYRTPRRGYHPRKTSLTSIKDEDGESNEPTISLDDNDIEEDMDSFSHIF